MAHEQRSDSARSRAVGFRVDDGGLAEDGEAPLAQANGMAKGVAFTDQVKAGDSFHRFTVAANLAASSRSERTVMT